MSAPDRIWAWEYQGQHTEGQWRSSLGACPTQGYSRIEYTRSDIAQAMVAAAYEVAAYECAGSNLGLTAEDVADDIRAHTPTDARAAIDAMLAKAREEGERAGLRKALDCIGHITQAEDRDAIIALIDRTAEGEA